MLQGANEEALVEQASSKDAVISNAALWMMLLLRLTAVTMDERLELRNSKCLSFCLGNLILKLKRCHPNFASNI